MNSESAQPSVPQRGTVEFNAALRVRATAPVSEGDYPSRQEVPTWVGMRLAGRDYKVTSVDIYVMARDFAKTFDLPWSNDPTHPSVTAIMADVAAYVIGKRRRIAANCSAARRGNVATEHRHGHTPPPVKPTRAGRPICPEHFIAIPTGMDRCDLCSDGEYGVTSQGYNGADDYLLVDA